jgi:hypothetical protein
MSGPLFDATFCPQPGCTAPADVVARWVSPSTDGPVEVVKTMCPRGHWFTPTTGWLAEHVSSVRVQPSAAWSA